MSTNIRQNKDIKDNFGMIRMVARKYKVFYNLILIRIHALDATLPRTFRFIIESVFLIHLMFFKYIHHGDHILNVVKLVVMEKKQEQEPALVEYAHVPQHKI